MSALLDAAQLYVHTTHLSVVSIDALDAKKPAGESWKEYQQRHPTPEEMRQWWGPRPGIGIVCGAISGNLTVIDFDRTADGYCAYDDWCDAVEAQFPGLVDRIPLVLTRGTGMHAYIRAPIVAGNKKLALRPITSALNAETGEITERAETIIETRGEGGQVLAPPTPGYTLLLGDLGAIPLLSEQEYTALLATAETFDEQLPDAQDAGSAHALREDNGDRPGDRYNRTCDGAALLSLLMRHGWSHAFTRKDGTICLVRPGKSVRDGISATIRFGRDVPILYIFSTNVPGFAANKGYSPFQVFARLEHGGDFSAAATALHRQQAPPLRIVAPPAQQQREAPPPGGEGAPQEADTRNLYKLWTDDELIALPLPEMLIRDILPARGLSVLYAAAGVGKSFLAIDWAYRVALGWEWFGLPCTQGQVLYVAAEGQGGLGKRLTAWRTTYNNGAGTHALRFITHPIYPTRADTFDTLQASLEATCVERPTLIVIDTLTRVNEGDENSTQDMTALINAIDAIRVRFDCAVLLIHHRGHTEGRIRGSSTLLGAADAVLALEKDKESGILTLLSNKEKESADFEPWNLVLKIVPVGETTSCVLSLAAGAPRKLTEPMAASLAIVADAGLEGARFSEIHTATGLPKSTLNRTLKELVFHRLVHAIVVPKSPGTRYQITTLGGTSHSCGMFHPSSNGASLVVPPSSTQFQGPVEPDF